MALGIKMKKVTFKNNYTLETLFEAIKDTEFAAGKAELTSHGMSTVIAFPALDSQNQVQILPASMKKESDSFRVIKAEKAGAKAVAGNAAINKLTGGLFGLKSVGGKNAKTAEKLVEETAKQLTDMGL